MAELKPCPFCGTGAEMVEEIRHHATGNKIWYRPICPECQCDLGMFYTEEEAVEAWNRRVHDD